MSFILSPNWSELVIPCLCLCPSCFSLDFTPCRLLLEVVSVFAAASFHFRRVSVPNGSYHNWSIRMIHRRCLAFSPNPCPSSLSHYVWPTRITDWHFLYSFYRPRPVCTSAFWIILNSAFSSHYCFFSSLSSSAPDYSNLLSSSGKNNLAALAQRHMSPQIRCHGSISAPVPCIFLGFPH